MEKQQYLKVYTGYSSGSFMGRDDGYPIDMMVIYEDIESVARSFDTQRNERYFAISSVPEDFKEQVVEELKKIKEKEKEAKKLSLQAQIEKLQQEMNQIK